MPAYYKPATSRDACAVDAWLVGTNGPCAVLVLRGYKAALMNDMVFALEADADGRGVAVLSGRGACSNCDAGTRAIHDWEIARESRIVAEDVLPAVSALYGGRAARVLGYEEGEARVPAACRALMDMYLKLIFSPSGAFEDVCDEMMGAFKARAGQRAAAR